MIASTNPMPSSAHRRERVDRDVLAAVDAVQVGVLQPHGADARLAQVVRAQRRGGGGLPRALSWLIASLPLVISGQGPKARLAASTTAEPPSTVMTAPLT